MTSGKNNKLGGYSAIEEQLRAIDAPDVLVRSFQRQYEKLINGETGLVDQSMIDPIDSLPHADELSAYQQKGIDALEHAVMIKLNGGLGTSMGLSGPKSKLTVKEGLSFLDVVMGQVAYIHAVNHAATPLLFMNSFVTHEPTMDVLRKHPEVEAQQEKIRSTFIQHRVPKLLEDSLQPALWPNDPEKEWCPPGHGDLYIALSDSGILDQLIEHGFIYAFVSNVDNLGASLDHEILGYFAERNAPFMMEVTDRTPADRKGGHLARTKDGHLLLRESAQCPADETEDFQDIEKYKFFNTNNLWINLKALKKALDDNEGFLDLPLIVNRKKVDPRDADSPNVVQLETAMGAAIASFENAEALRVPRSRFVPVKTTDDLIVLRSNVFDLTKDKHVIRNPDRSGPPPTVHLDPMFYGHVTAFEERFPHGAPDLLKCRSLRVEGDIAFGREVIIEGDVHLKQEGTSQALIEDKTKLVGTGKITSVTGDQ